MLEWLIRPLNLERWFYAVDCVGTLYGIQVKSSSTDGSPIYDSLHDPTAQQKINEYKKF
jgi:hypothetical protein